MVSTLKDERNLEASLLRGSLKLEISTSKPIVSAGTEFSIYVVIRNPFSVPVTIFTTETHIPVELSDENWRKNHRLGVIQNRAIEREEAESRNEVIKQHLIWWLSDISGKIAPDSGPRVAVAVTTEIQEALSRPQHIYIDGDANTAGDFIAGSRWQLEFGDRPPEYIRQVLFDINEFIAGRTPVVLSPGDSVVQHFILKTTRWLMFTPISYTFQIQVRYDVDAQRHVDTVPFALNIKAAMGSSLVGSIIGSILGTFVNPLTNFSDWMLMGRTLSISMIFAVIVVVAFARKSNAQQIVSVEDFWGGIFIGFLVGYSGNTFIESVL